jgi:hypothetical protein
MEERKIEEKDVAVYDYVMRPILLLVPPGSAQPVYEARVKEAEGLRGRFRGCSEGLGLARSLRDVAIRDQVTRSSSDLPAEIRKGLEGIPIGQLSAPEVTRLGVEMYAICNRHTPKPMRAGQEAGARMRCLPHSPEQQSAIPAAPAPRSPDRAQVGAPAMLLPLAVTLGEPAESGPDITLRLRRHRAELCLAVVLPPRPDLVTTACATSGTLMSRRSPSSSRTEAAAFRDVLPVVDIGLRPPPGGTPGCVERPGGDCRHPPRGRRWGGLASAVVTNPGCQERPLPIRLRRTGIPSPRQAGRGQTGIACHR